MTENTELKCPLCVICKHYHEKCDAFWHDCDKYKNAINDDVLASFNEGYEQYTDDLERSKKEYREKLEKLANQNMRLNDYKDFVKTMFLMTRYQAKELLEYLKTKQFPEIPHLVVTLKDELEHWFSEYKDENVAMQEKFVKDEHGFTQIHSKEELHEYLELNKDKLPTKHHFLPVLINGVRHVSRIDGDKVTLYKIL